MTKHDEPDLPIPEPLRGNELGTFTHYSVAGRLPDIARRTLAENEFTSEVIAGVEKLISEIGEGVIRPLRDSAASDYDAWNSHITPYIGQSWLDVPWFFVETYFYRRLLEATGYFGVGKGVDLDPFFYQKQIGLELSRVAIASLCQREADWLSVGWRGDVFSQLLAVDLWGNQADLSIWPADREDTPDHSDVEQQQAHTLVDDSTAVADYLAGLDNVRVDFMIDNAGFELVCDLCLADYLLTTGKSTGVHLHLKMHPTFVSDAMIKDVLGTFDFLAAESNKNIQTLAERLRTYVKDGRLRLRQHPYWTSPLAGWEMPADLQADLTASDLVISKGDANYRRLLGDRHWMNTTPFVDVLSYFPTTILALRTGKSEIIIGLTEIQLSGLPKKDEEWMYDGRWGLIQLRLKD